MESTAFHFHCDGNMARMLRLEAGDDAASVRWITVSADSDRYMRLYASHKDWVDKVAEALRPHRAARNNAISRSFGYPERVLVPDKHVSWAVKLSATPYTPPTYTSTLTPRGSSWFGLAGSALSRTRHNLRQPALSLRSCSSDHSSASMSAAETAEVVSARKSSAGSRDRGGQPPSSIGCDASSGTLERALSGVDGAGSPTPKSPAKGAHARQAVDPGGPSSGPSSPAGGASARLGSLHGVAIAALQRVKATVAEAGKNDDLRLRTDSAGHFFVVPIENLRDREGSRCSNPALCCVPTHAARTRLPSFIRLTRDRRVCLVLIRRLAHSQLPIPHIAVDCGSG